MPRIDLGSIGGAIGSEFGGPIGGAIGSTLGSAIGFGGGDKPSTDWASDAFWNSQNFAREMAAEDRRLARDFAQAGIRWRVDDARAAGLHPLYALGGAAATYSPPAIAGYAGAPIIPGQNTSRSARATMTYGERRNDRLAALQLERAQLENDFLRAQIAKETAQIGPAMPSASPGLLIEGQGDAAVVDRPMSRTSTVEGSRSQEPGAISDTGFAYTGTGWAPVPSSDVKNRIEDQAIPEIMWALRNLLLPNTGGGISPPKSWLPRGTKFVWNKLKQEWQAGYPGRRRPYVRPRGAEGRARVRRDYGPALIY